MALSALLLAPLSALAPSDGTDWTVTALLVEGDTIPTVGDVTNFFRTEVSDDGEWIVEVDTDNPDTDVDFALVRAGSLYLVEGQSLALPTGSLLDSFDSFVPNDAGFTSFNFFLDGTTGINDDSGIYVDVGAGPVLVYQEGSPLTVPGPANGAPWRGFFETQINDLNQVLTLATIDIAGVGTTADRILVLTTIDGAGAVVNEQVIAVENEVLPGQTEVLDDIETGSHQMVLTDTGVVGFVADLAGDTTVDQAIYVAGNVIAQEGAPSPVAGRNWESLGSSELWVSNSGNIVFSGTLDGDSADDNLIVLNGQKFIQEGDAPPVAGLEAFALTSFGSGPVFVDDSGGVLWYGDWDDPNTDVDSGLFYNDTLVLQEGVTTVNGAVIDTIRGVTDGYMMSNGGGWVTIRVVLEGIGDAALLLTRDGLAESLVACNPNPNTLSATAAPALGEVLQLQSTYTVGGTGLGLLYAASGPDTTLGPCGLDLGFGEILIDVLTPGNPIFFGSGLSSAGVPWTRNVPIPLDESFLGTEAWLQTAFIDALDPLNSPITLTNGLRVCVGTIPTP